MDQGCEPDRTDNTLTCRNQGPPALSAMRRDERSDRLRINASMGER